MNVAIPTFKDAVAIVVHILLSIFRVLKDKVDGIMLKETLAYYSVCIVIMVIRTFNEFSTVISHTIHSSSHLPLDPKPLSPRSVSSSSSTNLSVGIIIGVTTS
jgi:hypothetical protein